MKRSKTTASKPQTATAASPAASATPARRKRQRETTPAFTDIFIRGINRKGNLVFFHHIVKPDSLLTVLGLLQDAEDNMNFFGHDFTDQWRGRVYNINFADNRDPAKLQAALRDPANAVGLDALLVNLRPKDDSEHKIYLYIEEEGEGDLMHNI